MSKLRLVFVSEFDDLRFNWNEEMIVPTIKKLLWHEVAENHRWSSQIIHQKNQETVFKKLQNNFNIGYNHSLH